MLVPIYGFLEGDALGILVLAHDTDLVPKIVQRLTSACTVRCGETFAPEEFDLYFAGAPVEHQKTLAQAGIGALDRIDVKRRRQ